MSDEQAELPPFDEGPPVRVSMEPQPRGDERSDVWRKISAHPPSGKATGDEDDDE